MKKMSRKKIVAISLGIILAAAGVIGSTLALLKASPNAVTNDFAGAAVNIGVIENGDTAQPIETGGDNTYQKISKDQAVAKKVQIKNIDSEAYPTTDTYVRVRLVPIFRNAKGETAVVDAGRISYTYENAGHAWKKQTISGEVYYYYTKALAPDEVSSELITEVRYSGDVPEGTTLELQVLTEGVAAKQKDALKGAWEIEDFDRLENL